MKTNIHNIINEAIAQVKANNSKLDSVIKSGMYSITEIRNQETKTREANASVIGDMKAKLAEIKVSEIEKGKQKDIERGKKGDLEVANILSVLSITAKTITNNELNKMYQDNFFNPMLRMATEAVAAERRYVIDKPITGAFEAQQAFINGVRSYVDNLHPTEINANYEVVSGMLAATKQEITE